MQKFKLFFVLALAVFITACTNNNSAEVGVENETTEEKAEEGKKHSSASMTSGGEEVADTNVKAKVAVSLDGGKKWKANVETTQGIKEMAKSVTEAMRAETKDEQLFRTLGGKLQKDFNTIFEKCNMKGEAHDQLHNYLLPMVDMVKTFEKEDVESCNKTLTEIRGHLGSYFSYFE